MNGGSNGLKPNGSKKTETPKKGKNMFFLLGTILLVFILLQAYSDDANGKSLTRTEFYSLMNCQSLPGKCLKAYDNRWKMGNSQFPEQNGKLIFQRPFNLLLQ